MEGKIDGKVILLNAKGVEVGETYTRRARQLVKQQRAIWADDTHTAIQFMPDTEEEWEPLAEAADPTPMPVITDEKSSALYALAKKRIHDRKWLILHTLAVIPGYIGFLIFAYMLAGPRGPREAGFLWLGFSWGVWTTLYIYRVRNFIKEHKNFRSSDSWEARQRLKLQAEVDHLKRMGYKE